MTRQPSAAPLLEDWSSEDCSSEFKREISAACRNPRKSSSRRRRASMAERPEAMPMDANWQVEITISETAKMVIRSIPQAMPLHQTVK